MATPEAVPELLGQFEFFDGYSKEDIETVSRYLSRSTVSKGAVIFREGEPGSFMLFIVAGQVSV